MLDPAPFLSTARLGRDFSFAPQTRSTNSDAADAPEWKVVAADSQTAGRGRLGHVWHSPPGENLYFSAVFGCAGMDPAATATFPVAIGLAVARALEALSAATPSPRPPIAIKWPNDVLAGDGKICGILCEMHGHRIVCGVGVNVNQLVFPPDIAARATSLRSLLGGAGTPPLDRSRCLAAVLDSMEEVFLRWRGGGFAAVYGEVAARDALKGAMVSIVRTDSDPEPFEGICGGIAPDGSLAVGDRRFHAGEAHILQPPF